VILFGKAKNPSASIGRSARRSASGFHPSCCLKRWRERKHDSAPAKLSRRRATYGIVSASGFSPSPAALSRFRRVGISRAIARLCVNVPRADPPQIIFAPGLSRQLFMRHSRELRRFLARQADSQETRSIAGNLSPRALPCGSRNRFGPLCLSAQDRDQARQGSSAPPKRLVQENHRKTAAQVSAMTPRTARLRQIGARLAKPVRVTPHSRVQNARADAPMP
jgi:hypothetical protein